MNAFDIITAIAAVWAIISGWRKGLVAQTLLLAGLVVGVVLAVNLGARVGRMLDLGEQFSAVAGMAIVFAVVLLVMLAASFLLKRMLSLVALKWLDVAGGVTLALVKTLVILCICYSSFDFLNRKFEVVKPSTLDASLTFRPICAVGETVVPVVEWAKERIPDIKRAGEKVVEQGNKALDKL